jgi:hypothetical protein
MNGDNLNNAMCETSRNLRNRKKNGVSERINELKTNNKNRTVRHLYRIINECKNCCQLRIYLIKDENCNLLADTRIILTEMPLNR